MLHNAQWSHKDINSPSHLTSHSSFFGCSHESCNLTLCTLGSLSRNERMHSYPFFTWPLLFCSDLSTQKLMYSELYQGACLPPASGCIRPIESYSIKYHGGRRRVGKSFLPSAYLRGSRSLIVLHSVQVSHHHLPLSSICPDCLEDIRTC